MNALQEYYKAADTEIGQMIEGHYGWNEWCPEHAEEHLSRGTSKDVKHRPIDVHEAVTSWREYRCYQCQKLLWNKAQADGVPMPKDPFSKPQTDNIIAANPGKPQKGTKTP